jgi:hypothetical protein
MSETIIINLTEPAIANLTRNYLARQFPEFSFRVVAYYSELQHVVTHQTMKDDQLRQMQSYAQGVSDVLGKLLE